MEYEFSIGSFFIGMLIMGAGAALVIFYRQIADNFGSGASSYERFKLVGLITCGVGFLVCLNLHWFILGNLLGMFFNRQ
ncbi:MAG: hypothetical protein WCP11_01100 [Candidatus Saccharibacteria bacterium]